MVRHLFHYFDFNFHHFAKLSMDFHALSVFSAVIRFLLTQSHFLKVLHDEKLAIADVLYKHNLGELVSVDQ
jgi:hypothetical protein